uniref:Uncharacterized protein n=1 Tax=Rhipicephalus zambeziensis TaxID=60191 RepID=A0A224YIH8_9ACAR
MLHSIVFSKYCSFIIIYFDFTIKLFGFMQKIVRGVLGQRSFRVTMRIVGIAVHNVLPDSTIGSADDAFIALLILFQFILEKKDENDKQQSSDTIRDSHGPH